MDPKQEVYIRFKKGDKESELRLDSIDEQHKLAFIDGLFKFFDVDVNFQEMSDTYIKTGKAYRDFYNNYEEEAIEYLNDKPKVEVDESIKHEDNWKWADSAKDVKENNKPKIDPQSDDPFQHITEENNDFYVTGIKFRDNEMYFKCHYICPNCKNKSNRYMKADDKTIECFDCFHKMKPVSAHKDRFPNRDTFGNYFIAGEFQRVED